ncbi:hypothetical protein [Sphaerisporangium dianthi]|uniref:Serine/threonine protein kinase n=1 Tax=Sphaerisporangium dianthi TaxID=1436120 RepID=A0ABV9CFV7_9ACTN
MSPEQALAMAQAATDTAKAATEAKAAAEAAKTAKAPSASDTESVAEAASSSDAESVPEAASSSDTVEIRVRARPHVAGAAKRAEPVRGDAARGGAGGGRDESDEITVNVRRPGGPFPPRGGPASPAEPVARPRYAERRERPGALGAAVLRVGDIPIKAVYGIGALIATVAIVILIFALFSEDKPGDPVRVDPAQAGGPAVPSAPAKPTPPPIAVPPAPAAKAMTVFPGTGTPIAAYVLDRAAGITYVQYGAPWAKTSKPPFSAAQKVGSAKRPQALIASGPVPLAVPKAPTTYDGYRKLAVKAAKWTLRYQPAGSKFTWTVSQRARYNLGWVLGYKVGYVQGGKKHSSQAYVFVVSAPAKKKPAMLFATVTDAREALYHDLNMLFWTARAG